MKLYSYFRSSASYRVRVALNYKQLAYDIESVHLVKEGGQQFSAHYQKLNPQSLVPTLVDGEYVLTQSMAIMEYLEEVYPQPSILPGDHYQRAQARAIANIIACDIHPINNLRVLKYLTEELNQSEEIKKEWYQHWVVTGLTAIEKMLAQGGDFCINNKVSIADFCLIPQVYNALRFDCSLQNYPRIQRIYENCLTLNYFAKAAPEMQEE